MQLARSKYLRYSLILSMLLTALSTSAIDANDEIAQAMLAVKAGAKVASADPTRPIYHYCPPSGWISDPDGPIYHNGFYHTFYIHNPFAPKGWPHSRNHWGHARSRDLVSWEHLPIALAPLSDREQRCNSGCLTINGRGQPMIFYTHVPLKKGPNEQWAAVGDADLITWKRVAENPILSLDIHGGPQFSKSWRDPFIFENHGRTFMILTANLGSNAVVPIYEAVDEDLLDWKYRGIMFTIPQKISRFLECPNFVKLGDKWVLIGSGLDKSYALRYFVGSFDEKTLRFVPQNQGLVDHLDNFLYATNILLDDRGRSVLLSRIKHFKAAGAWNGCLALPRILSIDKQGQLFQKPVPELRKLRTDHVSVEPFVLKSTTRAISAVKGDSLEILVTFKPGSAKAFGLNLRRSEDGKRGVRIRYDGQKFTLGQYLDGKLIACHQHVDRPNVPGGELPFELSNNNGALTLHVFLDKSVMEVFINDGQACATRTIYPEQEDLGVELFSEDGNVSVQSLDAWTMRSIWENER